MADEQDKPADPMVKWWDEDAERHNRMGAFAYKNKLGMHGAAENDPLAQWWKEDAERLNAIGKTFGELRNKRMETATDQATVSEDKFSTDAPPPSDTQE